MFKNSIWNNPVGWSEDFVGTKFRFWLLICLQIFVGFLIIFTSFFTSAPSNYLSIGLPVIAGTILFPIMYIAALRKLFIELKKHKNETAICEGEQNQ